MNDPKSFLQSLFDFSFESFVVPKLIRIMYIVGVIISGLYALVALGAGFASGGIALLGALIGAPLFFLVLTVVTRSYCELILVQFSLLQNVERIAEHLTGHAGNTPPTGPVDGRGVMHTPSASSDSTPSTAPAPRASSEDTPPPETGGWGGDDDSSGGGWN